MSQDLVSKIRQVRTVNYHASCPDGTAAAAIVAKAFSVAKIDAEFVAIQYGSARYKSMAVKPNQMFVDITPPLERWREWEGTDVVVLDHHETAREATVGLGGVYATNESHSGAMLAYENVFLPLVHANKREWEDFAIRAMIHDTWKRDHALWAEANGQAEALSLFGAEEIIRRAQNGFLSFEELKSIGNILLKSIDGKCKKYARGAMRYEHAGLKVAVFCATEKIISEAGHYLLDQGNDVAVGWFQSVDENGPFYSVSLRTNEKISARRMAELNGGGGHDRAAGFRVACIPGVGPHEFVATVLRTVDEINR